MNEFEFRPQFDTTTMLPNIWDLFAFSFILAVFIFFSLTLQGMVGGAELQSPGIDLAISALPKYAAYSVVRMFVALFFSLVVAFALGTLAARSVVAERLVIPLVDVLQSIPILGYLTLAAAAFAKVFQGGVLGFEIVAVFAIFTSQVWNMILSFYQSLLLLPEEMQELACILRLRRIHKFWRIDVPYAMPGLLMNMMVSLSAGWFYIMESEAIVLSGQDDRILLPGLGSYMWQANLQQDYTALIWALFAMFIVILCYDQLMFRPLMHLMRSYQFDDDEHLHRSWLVNLLSRTRWFKWFMRRVHQFCTFVLLFLSKFSRLVTMPREVETRYQPFGLSINIFLSCAFVFLLVYSIRAVFSITSIAEVLKIFLYGFFTFSRVFILLIFCTVLWVPVGIWIGFRPRITSLIIPILQFLAAFPPNMLYPLLMKIIIVYELNVNIWCAPLMILGTQWYILFNVISAVQAIDKEHIYVAMHLGLKGVTLWKRLLFPSVAPHLVSGAMAASGGAWNASIVAEVLTWGGHTEMAQGLGAYIHMQALNGNLGLQVLGILVMCFYVVVFNRLFWHPLCRFVEKRYGT